VILRRAPQISILLCPSPLPTPLLRGCYCTTIALSLDTPTQLLCWCCQSWTTQQRPISVRGIQTCPLTSLPLTGKFFYSELTQHCTFCGFSHKFLATNATAVASAGTLLGVPTGGPSQCIHYFGSRISNQHQHQHQRRKSLHLTSCQPRHEPNYQLRQCSTKRCHQHSSTARPRLQRLPKSLQSRWRPETPL
jgi:hypothetical protein